MHGKKARVPADHLSGPTHPVGEQIADALPVRDHLDQLQHRAGIPEAQLQPAGILRPDQPVLVAFHRERHDRTRRDRVERVAAAQLVRLGDGLEVVDAAVGTETADRLILRPAVGVGHLIAVVDRDLALAAHRAGVTTAPGGQQLLLVDLPLDVVHALERALMEVAGGQDAAGVQSGHQSRRAAILQLIALRLLLDAFRQAAADLGDGGRIVGVVEELVRAAHRDPLEVLRAHDRAHAGAAVEMTQVVDQRREAHLVLAARADLQHAHEPVAHLLAHDRLGLLRLLTP